MDFELNQMLIDIINHLGDTHQDMLMTLFQSGVIAPSDTIEQALTKIDNVGNDYFEDLMDNIMQGIAGSTNNVMPNVTVITRDEPAAYGSLDVLGMYKPEEVTPAPDMMGISLQELMDSANEEDAVEVEWLVSKHFMKPSADVTELLIKLNTLLNPQMDGMGGVEDISVAGIDLDSLSSRPVGSMMPHEVHEHNKMMSSMQGLQLLERLVGQKNNPEQQKFINFLGGLKGNHDDELISIVESGFKMIHKSK